MKQFSISVLCSILSIFIFCFLQESAKREKTYEENTESYIWRLFPPGEKVFNISLVEHDSPTVVVTTAPTLDDRIIRALTVASYCMPMEEEFADLIKEIKNKKGSRSD